MGWWARLRRTHSRQVAGNDEQEEGIHEVSGTGALIASGSEHFTYIAEQGEMYAHDVSSITVLVRYKTYTPKLCLFHP